MWHPKNIAHGSAEVNLAAISQFVDLANNKNIQDTDANKNVASTVFRLPKYSMNIEPMIAPTTPPSIVRDIIHDISDVVIGIVDSSDKSQAMFGDVQPTKNPICKLRLNAKIQRANNVNWIIIW